MTIQAPTRITIEVHQPGMDMPGGPAVAPIVRVVPELAGTPGTVVASQPRLEQPGPAAFDPGPCRCLDDDDCMADHAND